MAWKGRGAEFGVSDFPDCSRAGERCEANAPSLTPNSLLPESGALSPPGLHQRLANILCKVNTATFVGCRLSVATAYRCHHSTKAAINSAGMNGHDCVPLKFYLWSLKCEFHTISCITHIFLLLMFFSPAI